jgi:hypothetical protein
MTKATTSPSTVKRKEYAPWRRAYYSGSRALPKNARRHPADTTIKWETTLAKSILIWATGQGYLDEASLPRQNLNASTAMHGLPSRVLNLTHCGKPPTNGWKPAKTLGTFKRAKCCAITFIS